MGRLLILAFVAVSILIADSLVDSHAECVQSCILRGVCERACGAYENPEALHQLHSAEELTLAIVFIAGLVCFVPTNKWSGLIAIPWQSTLKIIWFVGMLILFAMAGTLSAFEFIADGAEAQFGATLDFQSSLRPILALEIFSLGLVCYLLYLGPPQREDSSTH